MNIGKKMYVNAVLEWVSKHTFRDLIITTVKTVNFQKEESLQY